jgi:hypothetical protein
MSGSGLLSFPFSLILLLVTVQQSLTYYSKEKINKRANERWAESLAGADVDLWLALSFWG